MWNEPFEALQFSSYSPAFYVQHKKRLKDWKRGVNKVQTQGDRPKSSGFFNVSYFMEFLSCSEKRYSLICLEEEGILRQNIGYSSFPGVCSNSYDL